MAQIEAEKTPKHQTKTFGECATAYIEAHKAAWRNPKSEAAWSGTLQTYARKLGPMDVADVTTHDVFEVLNPIWLEHTPTAKNLRTRIEVDAHAQIIVALTQSAVDCGQLVPMIDAVEANLGRTPEQASADSGYCSEANLEALESRHIDGYVALGDVVEAAL